MANVYVEAGYDARTGAIIRLTFDGHDTTIKMKRPKAFRRALEALGVPLCVSTQSNTFIITREYRPHALATNFVVSCAEVLFEFSIGDREMSVSRGDAVLTAIIQEINDGCYWEDQAEKGTGSDNPDKHNQVSSDA